MILRALSTFALFCWWVSFTFYSAVVVPIGSALFDPIHQGFITREVTNFLNLLCGVFLLFSLAEIIQKRRDRVSLLLWIVIAGSLLSLLYLHQQMDAKLDAQAMTVLPGQGFYPSHRIYLWVSTLGWVAGGIWIVRRLSREA